MLLLNLNRHEKHLQTTVQTLSLYHGSLTSRFDVDAIKIFFTLSRMGCMVLNMVEEGKK